MKQIPTNTKKTPASNKKLLNMVLVPVILGIITIVIVSYFFSNKTDFVYDISSRDFNTEALNSSKTTGIRLNTASSFVTTDNETVGSSVLFINEVMADNDVTIADPYMNYFDWVELYNAGNETLNISGMYLTDDLTNPAKWQFPNVTTIDSDGYLLIWMDDNSNQTGLYATFKLNANGDSVALFAKDGETLIDVVTFEKQIRDVSYGRLPDGGEEWEYLSLPSPGWTNGERLPEEKIPSWILPFLIISAIVVMISIIVLRGVIIRRGYK